MVARFDPADRWWKQGGQAACAHCSQVLTETFKPISAMPEALPTLYGGT
jgi:hypothetical protein